MAHFIRLWMRGIGQGTLLWTINMFGLEYTRVQILVQLVGRQRYVDVPHRNNRPGVVIQQLKSMVKRSRGRGLIVCSRALRDPAKVAPTIGEVEEYAEGNHPVKVRVACGTRNIIYSLSSGKE